MAKKYVEIVVDGLPVPVTEEESNELDIADKVRAARAAQRLAEDYPEAEDYDARVGDDSDG